MCEHGEWYIPLSDGLERVCVGSAHVQHRTLHGERELQDSFAWVQACLYSIFLFCKKLKDVIP